MVSKRIDQSTPASLRRAHRGMVLSLIQMQPGLSRADLARSLGFSEMAATRIVRELVEADIVEEIADATSPEKKRKRLGRPKIGLRIRGLGLYAGGITVSAYHSEVTICDANGELLVRREIPYLVSDDIGETARSYGRELSALIEEAGVDPTRCVGVGVALAARTMPEENEIVRSDYFGWGSDGGSFGRALEEILDLPIRIENIANALASAEMRFGAARGIRDFIMVHVATLIGAAVMSDGTLVRGKDGIAGMIGHFRSAHSAHHCVCGRSDCLNLNATGFGILAKLGKVSTPGFDRNRLQEYAAALLGVVENPAMAPVVEVAGRHLAPPLDGVCKLLGPERVIVGGYLGTDGNYLRGLRAAAQQEFGAEWAQSVPIVAGEIAPTHAAALLALGTFCYSDRLDFERFLSDNGAPPLSQMA